MRATSHHYMKNQHKIEPVCENIILRSNNEDFKGKTRDFAGDNCEQPAQCDSSLQISVMPTVVGPVYPLGREEPKGIVEIRAGGNPNQNATTGRIPACRWSMPT